MASITNQEELDTVKELVQRSLRSSTGSTTHGGLWIGGTQWSNYNDIQAGGTFATDFGWTDRSFPMFPPWAEGQPDNQLSTDSITGETVGQHSVLLTSEYKLQDEAGASRKPALLLLPSDYNDKTKYPYCDAKGTFLTGNP